MLSNPASIFTLFDFFFSFLITFYLVLLPHPDGGGETNRDPVKGGGRVVRYLVGPAVVVNFIQVKENNISSEEDILST
jgi:hypothetical protein